MKKIIANADDFGRHELINAAVQKAVREGCLRSATLMPGGVAFAGAVKLAKNEKNLGVGIHFTLVNGNPILPKEEIPSLVDANGLFYDSYNIFVKRYLLGKISLEEVKKELAAQLNKIEGAGLKLTHADSHQHMHTLPGINAIVIELAAKAGIKAIRIPKAPLFTGNFGGVGQLIGRVGLWTLSALIAQKAKAAGLRTPEHFAGIVAGEAVSEAALLNIIDNLPEGVTEIMLHPGTDNAVLQRDCAWKHDFVAELTALTSTKVQQKLAEGQVAVVNFEELGRG
ncbi:MAG: ChbG/HpnK family deacetylase [Selenomonadaceae bacterium]|nr:ChbG/HpnK family deacetylase [Selenomonadaceae bacterium]